MCVWGGPQLIRFQKICEIGSIPHLLGPRHGPMKMTSILEDDWKQVREYADYSKWPHSTCHKNP